MHFDIDKTYMSNISMNNELSTLVLSARNDETAGLPGLEVQVGSTSIPNYSTDLYRLYLADHKDVSLTLDSQSILLKQGYLLTLSPGESVVFSKNAIVQSLSFHHNFVCVRVLRDEVYCDGIVFNRLRGLPIIAFPKSETKTLLSRFDELKSILRNPSNFSHERALSTIRTLLLHAADFKVRTSDNQSSNNPSNKRLSALIRSFKELVEKTYTQKKSVSFYSEQLGVTSATLNRRVKEELGQSVMQVINERIAIAARVALRTGEKSIKEVSYDMGFDDPLYFSRFFKKQFGSSPSQYFQNEKCKKIQSD